ncbi:hypothetical protein ACS0TY_001166 [Phlomoides rotata]
MSSCGAYGNPQFLVFSPPKLHKLPHSGRKSLLPLHIDGATKFLVRTASSAPLGGEYSEQLQGARPKQRTASIDQDEVEDPKNLADSDSCFCEFNGVQIHHKIFDAELSEDTLKEGSTQQAPTYKKTVSFPMILLHGFGASVFSWSRVMKPLSLVTGSKVLAFDRPAFGLTSRVNAVKHSSPGNQDSKPLNPFSMMFSVLATLYFIDFLPAEKVILVGHSAGALVAVDAYFEAPERVAALILVAPAIFAPLTTRNVVKENQTGVDNQIKGNSSDSNTSGNLFSRSFSMLSMFAKNIADAILNAMKGMTNMIHSLYQKALSAILRSAAGVIVIRMIIGKFGIPAVRSAWYDPNQVSDHVLQGYTKPLKVKGWDKALVEYTVALLTDSASKLKPPMAKRLSEISCPVLIVTGDTDRLVPSWNSEKLSRAIPGSSFELIKNCGHLPQEEKAEEFVSVVEKFLQRVFGVIDEPHLQAAT